MSGSVTPPNSDCPSAVLELIDRFERNLDSYKRPTYNETQVRREFIDPLFKSLGWDIDNEQGHAEAYKDVIHEDAIKVGGATKAPDYCFRIGGTRKFFLEAKKPAVPLKDSPESTYQLRRYAWSARLPLSILTDFEELAVYDCRIRPQRNDKPATGRTLFFRYDEYPNRWGELAAVFSRAAVLKGSFDKYAESARRKRGTAEVDVEFLKEIEEWRADLARNFALRNPNLSVRDLNFAVQRTIDRIIFLRMCEARGIEPYGQLAALKNGTAVYQRLARLFRDADDKYNSGLFYFQQEPDRGPPDELTLSLELDDKVLKDIFARLYYPESPYEFSVLAPEILGQVYEQFLGKVIRLTTGHQAKLEEKPEVRKAGGVYYTPTYIVDYIVKHTVGKLLEGKTPKDVGPDRETKTGKAKKLPKGAKMLRILDPACGSGSFLLGAYEYLLNWHRDWYVAQLSPSPSKGEGRGEGAAPSPSKEESRAEGASVAAVRRSTNSRLTPAGRRFQDAADNQNPKRERGADPPRPNPRSAIPNPQWLDRLYQGPGAEWRLTIREKKRILLNNIYGVDIDPQAVEVTKLSLLLKVLEHESAETLGSTLRLFHERALPDLADNVKCGNSLIGPDFYDGKQLDMFDEETRYRINVFDWKREFPEAFDQNRDRLPFTTRSVVKGQGAGQDEGGFDAVIGNPPYVLLQDEFRDDLQLEYFRARYRCATYKLDTYHLFMERGVLLTSVGGRASMITPANFLTNNHLDVLRRFLLDETNIDHILVIDGGVFHGISVDNAVWVVGRGATDISLICVIHARPELPGLVETVRQQLKKETVLRDPHVLFTGSGSTDGSSLWERCIAKSTPLDELAYVNFGKQLRNRKVYKEDVINAKKASQLPPKYRPCYTGRDVERYVLRWGNLACLNDREAQSGGCWDGDKQDAKNKLITRQIGRFPMFALDELGYQCLNTVFMVNVKDQAVDPLYLLGILNSKLLATLWLHRFYDRRRTFPKIKGTYLKHLPIRTNDPDGQACQCMVRLVQQMLDLHKLLYDARTAQDKTAIQRQIDATDRQIDKLVYELYNLTDDEIRIVEEATM